MAEVTLRRFELSDVDAMMAWASDPQVAFCRWEPYESKEPLLAFLRDTLLPHPWFRAVCAPGSGAVVGAVSVAPSPAERCRGELGYVLARAHWGKGVATAAVRCALRDAFAEVEGCGASRRWWTWTTRRRSAWRRRPGSAARASCGGTTGTRAAPGTWSCTASSPPTPLPE